MRSYETKRQVEGAYQSKAYSQDSNKSFVLHNVLFYLILIYSTYVSSRALSDASIYVRTRIRNEKACKDTIKIAHTQIFV